MTRAVPPAKPRPAGFVAAIVAALVLAGCSEPTDVTGSAGAPDQPTDAGGAPVIAEPGEVPEELLAGLPPCPSNTAEGPVPGGLPPVELACLGPGGPVLLSGLKGPMILNAWASWCAPCREELPALASFSQSAGAEVAVLGLDVADDPASAAALWAELDLPFPSVTDPDANTRADLRWIGLPVTYFVDAEGVVVHRHDGAVVDPDEWSSLAAEHLGVGG